jgi:pimeloyl-ACP methyl ester carboxylesterase
MLPKLKVRVGSHDLAYWRGGSGAPVLLVHGITTCSFIWRRIAPVLAQHYDVVAVDLLGCGGSDKPLTESYALRDHASRLAKFVEILGVGRVHFVGHDLGGGIAQIMAVRHAHLVRSVSMLNAVGYDFWPVQPILALRTPVIREFLMAAVNRSAMKLIVQRGLHHRDRANEELMSLFMQPLQTAEGRKAFLHFARCLDNRDLMSLAADLPHVKLPTLIVRGDADPYLSATIAERLHAAIPGSRLERIATASHFLQEDEPEILNQLLLDFLGGVHE